METTANKYMSVSYRLYDITDGKKSLIEQTSADKPFVYLTGFGITIPKFEELTACLAEGEEFGFDLQPADAYGEHEPSHVIDINKEAFYIDGRFDSEHVRVGGIIPLQNQDGNRFHGLVLEINDNIVKVDLNHPLAGKTLRFEGKVLESREATNEEITHMANMLSGEEEGHCHCGGHGHCGGKGKCGDGKDHCDCDGHGDGHCKCHHEE